MRFYRKVAWAGCLAAILLTVIPMTASATVTGGCTVSGTASISGTTDLTKAEIWHLQTGDVVKGSAKYPTQTFVHIYAFLFGIQVPVYSSSGKDTQGSAGPFKVSDYSRYTRVFAAGGASDTCTGAVLIVVDDQNPFTELAGLVGLILAAIGVVGLLLVLLARGGPGGCGTSILGALAGLLAGLGAALVAIETGVLDPRSVGGLAVIGVGVIVGLLITFLRRRMA